MTTFDLVQIQDFVASLDARMGPALNGATDSQAALDAALRDHANLCHEFTEQVRAWRQAVFSGRIEFDPEVETVILAEGARLAARAEDLWNRGAQPGPVELKLTNLSAPQPSIEWMNYLLNPWLRPKLAVGPGPRNWMYLTPEMIEEGRRRIAALPPLPADWMPADPEQRARFRKLRGF